MSIFFYRKFTILFLAYNISHTVAYLLCYGTNRDLPYFTHATLISLYIPRHPHSQGKVKGTFFFYADNQRQSNGKCNCKMQTVNIKLKRRRLNLILSVNCFVHWVANIAILQLAAMVWAALSLIKKIFDSFSASVWKLSRSMWRGLSVLCC